MLESRGRYFNNSKLDSLEEYMAQALKLLGQSHYDGDVVSARYFKTEYIRLLNEYREEMLEWLKVW